MRERERDREIGKRERERDRYRERESALWFICVSFVQTQNIMKPFVETTAKSLLNNLWVPTAVKPWTSRSHVQAICKLKEAVVETPTNN